MFRACLVSACMLSLSAGAEVRAEPKIIDRPIRFGEERRSLTRDYIKKHYGLTVKQIKIVPRAVVVHWTGTRSLKGTWRAFNRVRMRSGRRYLIRGGRVNVSAHFLVDRDGTIYRMVPETWMLKTTPRINLTFSPVIIGCSIE